MPHITLRLDEELLEAIEDDLDPEQSRSEWLRQASRSQLVEDPNSDIEHRLDDLEARVNQLEQKNRRNLLDLLRRR